MGSAIALAPIGLVVLFALGLAAQALLNRLRATPSVAEMVDQALDSGPCDCGACEEDRDERTRAVVAGSDLDWQLDIRRFYRDYDRYRSEHLLPGEGR
jgi:hypothetical protein